MQDEINEKVVALSVKGAKLTAEMLQKAIKAMLAQAKKQQEKQPHGKQTLKQLAKQNAGLSNIEISGRWLHGAEHGAPRPETDVESHRAQAGQPCDNERFIEVILPCSLHRDFVLLFIQNRHTCEVNF